MRSYSGAGLSGMFLAFLATTAACSRRDNAATDTLAVGGASTGASAAAATATPNADVAGMTDGNIAATIKVLNDGQIELGELATKKASSAQIKTFARDMIRDHTAMQKSLDSLAAAKNLAPQTAPMSESIKSDAQAMHDRLDKLSGATFDSAYINGQVTDHQKALDALNNMSSAATDADVKSAIRGAIPMVQGHLDRARSLTTAGRSTSTDSAKKKP
jgi:putative membrane protein